MVFHLRQGLPIMTLHDLIIREFSFCSCAFVEFDSSGKAQFNFPITIDFTSVLLVLNFVWFPNFLMLYTLLFMFDMVLPICASLCRFDWIGNPRIFTLFTCFTL